MGVDVWSVTSWSELRRDAMTSTAVPYLQQALAGTEGPVIAVSDWMRAVPDQISPWIDRPWTSLGTDGFGLSGTREAVREHFGVDPRSIADAVLKSVEETGRR